MTRPGREDVGPAAPTAGDETIVLGTVSRSEWRWVVAASLAVMAFTCLPYLFGWLITPQGYQYMGLLANPDEHNVYLGWMQQAERGRLLFLDPFTTEPQQAGFLHAFFLALGLVSRLTHLPLIWIYHIARVISGALLLVGVYALAAQVYEGRFARRLGWAFAAFSSGLGWFYALLNPTAAVHPIDFGAGLVMPEAITFLSLLFNPLFCFSVFLMVAVFIAYLAALRAKCWRLAALGGVGGLVLGNVHTYDVFAVWLTLGLYVITAAIIGRRVPLREAAYAALIGIMAMPFVIYQYWLFQTNTVFRDKVLTPTLTPPGLHFLLGFGLIVVLAAAGAVVAVRRRSRPQALLVAWVAATLLLVFLAPFSFQRKLAEGLHIPLCLLAALSIGEWAAPRLSRSAGVTLALVLVVVTMPSNLFFVARGFRDLLHNNAAYVKVLMPPLYLPNDTVDAMRWLRDHANMTDGVLCLPLEGSYLPGVAGNTVYIGHWAETLRYPAKVTTVLRFFSNQASPTWRREFMQSNGLRYVLYTANETAAGPFDPASSPELFEPVFTRPGAVLFRLRE